MMDNDRYGLVLEVVKKLKEITKAVQLLPFVYCVLYIFAILVYLFGSDTASVVCDHLFYVSITVIIYNLILSRILKLCFWHKTACLIPLIPELVGLADKIFIELSIYAEYVNLGMIITMTALLLISAYKVFFTNGR